MSGTQHDSVEICMSEKITCPGHATISDPTAWFSIATVNPRNDGPLSDDCDLRSNPTWRETKLSSHLYLEHFWTMDRLSWSRSVTRFFGSAKNFVLVRFFRFLFFILFLSWIKKNHLCFYVFFLGWVTKIGQN